MDSENKFPFMFDINYSFAQNDIFSPSPSDYEGTTPIPIPGNFLLLDNTDFLLLDGTNFTLL